jgi:hypothetical protein
MPDSSGGPYKVVWSQQTREQVHRWANKAADLGMRDQYLAALRAILQKMADQPLTWGDPLYRLHQLGLVVYRGLYPPLRVHYAADESRRIVYVKEVDLLPGSPPGQGP